LHFRLKSSLKSSPGKLAAPLSAVLADADAAAAAAVAVAAVLLNHRAAKKRRLHVSPPSGASTAQRQRENSNYQKKGEEERREEIRNTFIATRVGSVNSLKARRVAKVTPTRDRLQKAEKTKRRSVDRLIDRPVD